jgi:ribosome recycling factor
MSEHWLLPDAGPATREGENVIEDIKKDANERMDKSVAALRQELTKMRTGRAHTSLLDQITVDYYGTQTPLSQVANVNVEDSRTLTVSPWEKSMVQAIEKAIMTADLGLNPATAGTIIRVPLPPLTEERRKDMIKLVRHEAEGGRIAVRNIRRDAISDVKDLLKEKMIGQDDEHRAQDEIQAITDKHIADIDQTLTQKESELLEI